MFLIDYGDHLSAIPLITRTGVHGNDEIDILSSRCGIHYPAGGDHAAPVIDPVLESGLERTVIIVVVARIPYDHHVVVG